MPNTLAEQDNTRVHIKKPNRKTEKVLVIEPVDARHRKETSWEKEAREMQELKDKTVALDMGVAGDLIGGFSKAASIPALLKKAKFLDTYGEFAHDLPAFKSIYAEYLKKGGDPAKAKEALGFSREELREAMKENVKQFTALFNDEAMIEYTKNAHGIGKKNYLNDPRFAQVDVHGIYGFKHNDPIKDVRLKNLMDHKYPDDPANVPPLMEKDPAIYKQPEEYDFDPSNAKRNASTTELEEALAEVLGLSKKEKPTEWVKPKPNTALDSPEKLEAFLKELQAIMPSKVR